MAWHFNPSTLVLAHDHPYYEIDLERCCTAPELLDWIFQISEKAWLSDEDLGQAIRELDRLLIPQMRLCSCGKSGTIDDVREAIAANLRLWRMAEKP